MKQINYRRNKKKHKNVSPTAQRVTRQSLIKYMFRLRDNQKQADILMGKLNNLRNTIKRTEGNSSFYLKISRNTRIDLNRQIQEMELIVKEIQKEINTDV